MSGQSEAERPSIVQMYREAEQKIDALQAQVEQGERVRTDTEALLMERAQRVVELEAQVEQGARENARLAIEAATADQDWKDALRREAALRKAFDAATQYIPPKERDWIFALSEQGESE